MKLRTVIVGCAVLAVGAALVAAKENFTEGSTWTGLIRTVRIDNRTRKAGTQSSKDVKLVIKSVDEGNFTGELYQDSDKEGLEVEGKITSKGAVTFYPTKKIKGGWPENIIGNWQFSATLKGKQMTGRASIPATNNSYTAISEYTLKLKDKE